MVSLPKKQNMFNYVKRLFTNHINVNLKTDILTRETIIHG